ncbi:two-partner secretion domain-containing protein [Campylobacter hyointestinalis]|uniref:two-partner secretion domain-containing protein n=1 Tax=Campylobacter hyointestinalis TaxID=198 RepID=UPI000CE4C3BB|nr:filamentous hemagglutinin N-terminal domain-containing protein [Campylobacter hyointestinalis]PPB51189.1 hypothetical protein CDQ68_08510 [Campylobacter hyointestinalis subsp. hyointestinalis]PPB65612.1 hypothetical protein CDQ75_08915 [Campylobacter hyointestinalis subsp. hyointestinalis]PPB68054.1 hypothetical protein CDQ77_08530 [Campylobacter hyointestinalis subsp. hyointestinalis]
MLFIKQLLSIFTALSLIVQTCLANIIPDLSAAKSNQPVILKANNEALIVNIVTPNNKGISFNEYSKFNTPDTGTVLNNSVNGDTTSIAGFIQANPFLNSGSAKLIINQVNSNDPSLLKGNLEIAGKRADLIIANPSGININGLNIINANSSTFVASKLNLNTNGDLAPINLSSPNLSQSVINIQGNGLNDKNSNYTNIIANTIKIASAVHSNELNLIASDAKAVSNQSGLFSVLASNEPNTNRATNPASAISIDSTALGGMYANKINIIATKDGVGVNNAGIIKANEISINANGDIINSNTIVSDKQTNIHSNQAIINKDKANIISKEDISLNANEITNTNSSNIIAANNLNLSATNINNASSNILANYISIKADTVKNYSLNELQTEFSTTSDTLNLGCCGDKVFNLSVDIKKIKDEIINKWQLEGKTYTDNELSTELYNAVVSQDPTAYALNLQKDSHLHGTSSHPYNNIRLDEASNSIIITTRHAKDNEKTRTLYYSITKEFITPDSLANFIPSKIYSANDIDIDTKTFTNDKSQVYASHDIRIKNGSVDNIGQDIHRNVSSHTTYYWEEKVKWYKNGSLKTKWETKGGDSAHKNYTYQEDGYPAILAANNGFYASVINLNNGDIKDQTSKSINIPMFRPNPAIHIDIVPINTGFLYDSSGASMAFMLNKFDSLYSNANSLINNSLSSSKHSLQINQSSLIIAKNEISIDVDGNIFNSAAMIANNISLNSDTITNKDATLIADSAISLNANKDLNLSSTSASANQIALNANDININQTSQTTYGKNYTSTTLGTRSNLNSTQSLEIKANNDISINGAILNSDQDINLKANNSLAIKTSQSRDSFNIGGKDTTFKGTITKNTSSNLKAANINARANNISLVGANLNANESINLKADKNIEISSINNQIDLTSTVTQKGFLSKKTTTTKTIKEDVVSSNLNANNINIISNKDTTIQGANLVADRKIDITANNINLTPITYSNQEITKTSKSNLGSISKSSLNKTDILTNKQGSSLQADQINLNANSINLVASIIQASTANINAQILNLISDKSTNIHTEFKQGSGILTATITDKGKIKEVEIPAIIKIKEKFILNGNDITDKLDIKTYNKISNTLNSQEFKEGIIKELTSNPNTPIDEKTINQIKATLNSKEWDDKTTTLSGIGSLIITAIVTYLTAGAGAAFAGGIGLASGTASATAVSAMSSAVITQTASSVVASAITGNKPNIDLGSLATNAISAGVMSYANFALGTNALTENMNISDYAKNATINGVGQGITSQIKGQNFKDGFISGAVISVLSDSALQMRKYVKDNYDYLGKNGEIVPENAQSVGVRGDRVKLAGSHLEKIYDKEILKGKPIIAPFGGSQTGERLILGNSYEKGSIFDYANESFAGPHDFMSSWNYENINGLTYLKNNDFLTGTVVSGTLLIPSAPFAIAPFVQDNWTNIEIYRDLKRQNKNIRNEILDNIKDNR